MTRSLALAALCCVLTGCDLFSPKKKTEQTATTKQGSDINSGGGDVWNFQFSKAEQAAGGGLTLAMLGWGMTYWRGRKTDKALGVVIDSIEESQCKDCKSHVQRRCDRWLNKRVRARTKGKA